MVQKTVLFDSFLCSRVNNTSSKGAGVFNRILDLHMFATTSILQATVTTVAKAQLAWQVLPMPQIAFTAINGKGFDQGVVM